MKFYNYKDVPSNGFYFMFYDEEFHNRLKINSSRLRYIVGEFWYEVSFDENQTKIAEIPIPWADHYKCEQVMFGPIDPLEITSMAKCFNAVKSIKIIENIIK